MDNHNDIERLTGFILENWDGFETGKARPARLELKKISNEQALTYHALIVNIAGEPAPVLYIKFVALKLQERYLKEIENLKLIAQKVRAPDLCRTIDPSAAVFQGEDLVFLISKYISVPSMYELLRRSSDVNGILAMADALLDWLGGFQREALRQEPFAVDRAKEQVDYLTSRLDNVSEGSRSYFSGLVAGLAQYSGQAVPVSWSHGDLVPSNIFLDEGRVFRVVDWEEFSLSEMTLRDLIRFFVVLIDNCSDKLRSEPDRFLQWLQQRLAGSGLAQGFIDLYVRLVLIMDLNTCLRRSRPGKINESDLLSMKVNGFPVVYRENKFVDAVKRVLVG